MKTPQLTIEDFVKQKLAEQQKKEQPELQNSSVSEVSNPQSVEDFVRSKIEETKPQTEEITPEKPKTYRAGEIAEALSVA